MAVSVRSLVLALALTACAGDTALRAGVAASNTLGAVLTAVDGELAVQQQRDRAAADLANPIDSTAYGKALAVDNARADALSVAWHAHGLLHVALAIWQTSGDSSAWPNAAACAAGALKGLAAVLPTTWSEPLAIASAPLLAAGGRCTVAP